MVSCASALRCEEWIPARKLLKLQGLMVSLGGIVHMGKLHHRMFQEALKPLRIHADINSQVWVPSSLTKAVQWWTR